MKEREKQDEDVSRVFCVYLTERENKQNQIQDSMQGLHHMPPSAIHEDTIDSVHHIHTQQGKLRKEKSEMKMT